MSRRLVRALAGVTAATALLMAPTAAHAAEALFGVTADNRLVGFTSDAPADVAVLAPIGGLQQNENVVGLDVRPNNDVLYAVTSANRILQVNPITGATRPLFTLTTGLNGSSFGVGFNPVADALRIVSDANQNLRVPFGGDNAGATNADGNLAYAGDDPGAGTDPSVGATAYTNGVPGATTTEQYGIDSARDVLVRVDPPNAGTLRTVGALGVDVQEPTALDISANGNVAYLAARRTGQDVAQLFRIDLATGRATASAQEDRILVGDRPGDRLVGLTTLGTVPDDRTAPQYSVAFSSTILEQNTRTLRPSISCDETCFVTVSATVEGIAGGTGEGVIAGAGQRIVEVPLNQAARNRIARRGTELIRLRITIRDAAGNARTANRVSRTQTLAARRG
jgi:hypothetical protein